MRSSLRTYFLILALSISVLSFAPRASAQATTNANNYNLLAPLPLPQTTGSINAQDTAKTTTPAQYIKGIINLAVAVAGIIAVVKLVFAGFTYIASDSWQSKDTAKKSVSNAIIGLLLAIGAFTILNTIGTQFTHLTINPDYVGSNKALTAPGVCISGNDANGNCIDIVNLCVGTGGTVQNNACVCPDGSTSASGTCSTFAAGSFHNGSPWPADESWRHQYNLDGIQINNPNCTTVGQQGCTSLSNIDGTVLPELKAAMDACKDKLGNPCSVIVTGGTEYWLHPVGSGDPTDATLNTTAHRPGGKVLDISLKSSLTQWLQKWADHSSTPGCTVGTERYVYDGALYVNETIAGNDPHWHVCFGSYSG